MVPAALECYAFCSISIRHVSRCEVLALAPQANVPGLLLPIEQRRPSLSEDIILMCLSLWAHSLTDTFLGTQGFQYSRCVTISGLPANIHILHQLGISSPFSSCLTPASSSGRGKRQQFQSNSRRRQSSEKRKPDPNKASSS